MKLEVDTIALQERKAVEQFYGAVRKATPQVRALAERYGGDVAFSFDSNGRSIWVVAVFWNGAPPALSALVHKYRRIRRKNRIPLPPSTRSGCALSPSTWLRTGLSK